MSSKKKIEFLEIGSNIEMIILLNGVSTKHTGIYKGSEDIVIGAVPYTIIKIENSLIYMHADVKILLITILSDLDDKISTETPTTGVTRTKTAKVPKKTIAEKTSKTKEKEIVSPPKKRGRTSKKLTKKVEAPKPEPETPVDTESLEDFDFAEPDEAGDFYFEDEESVELEEHKETPENPEEESNFEFESTNENSAEVNNDDDDFSFDEFNDDDEDLFGTDE